MSTHINQYLMFAASFDTKIADDDFDEKYEEYINNSFSNSKIGGKNGIFAFAPI